MAARPCIFEYIYFSRPDSIVGGRTVYDVRKTMGAATGARSAGAMPMSSCRCPTPACRRRSALRKSRTSPSNSASSATTMSAAPSSSRRSRSATWAYGSSTSANRAVVKGKRIVLVDDSIVRGTTSMKIVQMMRDAGASEVHYAHRQPADHALPITTASIRRSATSCSPPRTISKTCASSSAPTTLAFLSVDGIYRAVGYEARDPRATAIHRPLLHRRLSDRAHRSRRQRSQPAPVVAARRSDLRFRVSRHE